HAARWHALDRPAPIRACAGGNLRPRLGARDRRQALADPVPAVCQHQGNGPGAGPGDLSPHCRVARRHVDGEQPAGRRRVLHAAPAGAGPGPRTGSERLNRRPSRNASVPTLLVIDDEPSILHAFRRAFRDPSLTLLTASTAAEGLDLLVRNRPDVALLDIHLPDQSGLDAFRRIKEIDARIPVVFITGHGTTETAIEAMKLGAYDYLLKPLDLVPLRELVTRALEISRLMHVPALLAAEQPGAGPSEVLVGRCPAMQEVYKAIGRVAPQDVTVLILGESGTGKE